MAWKKYYQKIKVVSYFVYTYVYEIAPQDSYLFSTIFFSQQVSIVLTIAPSIERLPGIYVLISEETEMPT